MARQKLIHIHSKVSGQEPATTGDKGLVYGEIAVNYAAGNERLYIKNTSDKVKSFIAEDAINAKLAGKSNNGHTHPYMADYDLNSGVDMTKFQKNGIFTGYIASNTPVGGISGDSGVLNLGSYGDNKSTYYFQTQLLTKIGTPDLKNRYVSFDGKSSTPIVSQWYDILSTNNSNYTSGGQSGYTIGTLKLGSNTYTLKGKDTNTTYSASGTGTDTIKITPSSGNATSVTINNVSNADMVDGKHASAFYPMTGGPVNGFVRSRAYDVIGNNNASFIFDKPGSNYSGIGANGEASVIKLGACNENGTWVDETKQTWKFNGGIQLTAEDDNYGVLPSKNNFNQIGSSSMHFYRGWINQMNATAVTTTTLTASGNATAAGFVKSGSNDNYVLTGGGSHKAISGLSTSESSKLEEHIINGTDLDTLTGECKVYYAGGSNNNTNKPSGVDAFGLLTMKDANGYTAQLCSSSNQNPGLYFRTMSDGASGTWYKMATVNDIPTVPVIPDKLPADGGNADTVDGEHASAFVHTNGDYVNGCIEFEPNKPQINFRPSSAWHSKVTYMTEGNEALVLSNKNQDTSYIFKCGYDAQAVSTWQAAVPTPTVQMKRQSLYVNEQIPSNTAPEYNFKVNGTSYLGGDTIVDGTISSGSGVFNNNLANYLSNASELKGLCYIELANGWISSMNTYEVDIYEYDWHGASKLIIGGYNYGNGYWVSTSTTVEGNLDKKVRLGYVGDKCCIMIGTKDSVWSYPQIYLKSVNAGFNAISSWRNGYKIKFTTDESIFSALIEPSISYKKAQGFKKVGSDDTYVLTGGGGSMAIHQGRNNEANKIVRTNSNGYILCGYINSDSGDEKNASSPAYVWGTNGSDSYLRTYNTSYLHVYKSDYLTTVEGTSNSFRPVFFGFDNDTSRIVYDSLFKYNPSTDTLRMPEGGRIDASGKNLLLGNADNSGWVQVQDICSQVSSASWNITQAGNATFSGTAKAGSFVKTGSSDSYVLLGGGGHKGLSNFTMLRAAQSSNSNADLLLDGGFYPNNTGNGSGNSNWPGTYGRLFSWGNDYCLVQMYTGNNGPLQYRSGEYKLEGREWKTLIDNTTIGSQSVSYASSAGSSGSASTLSPSSIPDNLDDFNNGSSIKWGRFSGKVIPGIISNDGMILSIPWSSTSYGYQLAFDDQSIGMAARAKSGSTWSEWSKIAFEKNVLPLSGGSMSGKIYANFYSGKPQFGGNWSSSGHGWAIGDTGKTNRTIKISQWDSNNWLTSGETRVNIELNGNLLLGNGGSSYGARLDFSSTDPNCTYIEEDASDHMKIYSQYGITMTTDVNHGVHSTTGFFDDSDERLKNFKGDINVDLEKIKGIPKKYFTWKTDDTEKMNIGTSAQEVQKLFPELVLENSDGYLSVDYAKLSIVALKAVDELNEKNERLEEKCLKMEEELRIIKEKLGL